MRTALRLVCVLALNACSVGRFRWRPKHPRAGSNLVG
jgi:hypothetical protein